MFFRVRVRKKTRAYPEEGTTAGALQHSYCGHYEWILVARVVWVVCYVVHPVLTA